MNKYLIPLLWLLASCSQTSTNLNREPDFVSRKASEAEMQFEHWVEIRSKDKPSKSEAMAQVEEQVLHLFGPMEREENYSVPKEDHEITINKIEPSETNLYKIYYSYRGTIVVEKGPRKFIEVLLPNNPDTIFSESSSGKKNFCTDPHYQTEGDFWYFWSPTAHSDKCPLKEGEHYETIRAEIQRIANDRISYPEYHRLANKNNEVIIMVLFGMDDPSLNHDPMKSKDITAGSYRGFRNGLIQMGFTFEDLTNEQVKKIIPKSDSAFTFEEAFKEYGDAKIRLQLFYGESGMDEKSEAFHYAYRNGIKNASVLIYDGHSGLGDHLDLSKIAKLRNFRFDFPKEKYQIFFFNSCTSYTYYNARYLQRKESARSNKSGTKNLDLLVNGLATYFDEEQVGNLTLIRAIDLWAKNGTWTSYQTLAKRIDTENLFSVIGDEDNPNRPVKK
jgi:hypothetical protein